MKIPKVTSIYILFPFSTEPEGFQRWFIQTLQEVDARLLPGRYGQYYPMKKEIVGDDFDPFVRLKEDVWWKGRVKGVEGHWFKTRGPQERIHSYLLIDSKGYSTHSPPIGPSLTTLFERVCRRWPVHLGSINYNSEQEAAEYAPWSFDMDNQVIFGPINLGWLQKCLPNIAWGTFFGEPYVKLVGEERFKSAPAFKVERWLNGLYVQLTDRIEDRRENWEKYKSVRDAVKQHLGSDLFYIQDHPRDGYRAPKFVPLPVNPTDVGT